ncbi:MAG TPA: dTDP-4-dehydrorhamnose 3,5-epimerase family protein, partial [Blastocatellia bacterium]|nr:dTDP-4-dehydrorhamnose 3,5-epimerase family protein [Blastocatellia bacterium]
MKRIDTALPGVWIIEPEVWRDERGFFFESFSKRRFVENGLDLDFVQDNHSRSGRGV